MQDARPTVTETDRARAAFLPPTNALPPRVPEPGLRTALLRRLDNDVVRNRPALTVHVQRLLLYLQEGDAEGTQGALLDLFIALGRNGRALRKSMLERVRALLHDELAAFLESRLDSGISEFDNLPVAPASRLSRGICGHMDTVARLGGGGLAPVQDRFAVAEQYLDDGQVGEAVSVLEELLEDEPGHSDAARLLLDVYRRGQLYERFLALLPRMSEASEEVRAAWQAYALELRGDGGSEA